MDKAFYLVRHCQASGQESHAPLTELGQQQAIALAECLLQFPITRIISSPYARAVQSIEPLAMRLRLPIETDARLAERVLSPTPLENWRDLLAESFVDLDLCVEGGESSRIAMMRGVSVLKEALLQTSKTVVLVTHGNLLALMLRHFDDEVGFSNWQALQNPDVFRITFRSEGHLIEHVY
jgi:2,3-bisphosphoglycerate-dependent phosphoglycerate mutase